MTHVVDALGSDKGPDLDRIALAMVDVATKVDSDEAVSKDRSRVSQGWDVGGYSDDNVDVVSNMSSDEALRKVGIVANDPFLCCCRRPEG